MNSTFKINLKLFSEKGLKDLLGEELYSQVSEKLGDTKIDIVSDGNWIPKDKFNSLNETKKDLEGQLEDRDKQLKDISKKAEGNQELQQQIKDLQEVNEKSTEEYETRLSEQAFNFALEGALVGSDVRNTKAVKALLNLDNVKLDGEILIGLKEQLESLKESDKYLFKEEEKPPQFTGVNPVDGTKQPQGYNPWKKDTFNLTDQGRIFKENPEQAQQLMTSAGVNQ